VGVTWLIYRLRNFSAGGADSSINSLIGATGTVITPIPDGCTGEVDIRYGGERHRFNAVADEEIPSAGQVNVVGVVSPTCVRVVHLR